MSSKTSSSTSLQPPGAGLPSYELAWLQVCMRLAYLLVPRQVALWWFKREAERILALVRAIPTGQGRVPVLIDRIVGIEDSSRGWSVFMVLDHLRIVSERISQLIEMLTQGLEITYRPRIEDVKPQVGVGEEVIDQYRASVVVHESMLDRMGTPGRRLRLDHPWFGPMSAHDWYVFASIHQWVHRRQIERIVRRLALGEM